MSRDDDEPSDDEKAILAARIGAVRAIKLDMVRRGRLVRGDRVPDAEIVRALSGLGGTSGGWSCPDCGRAYGTVRRCYGCVPPPVKHGRYSATNKGGGAS